VGGWATPKKECGVFPLTTNEGVMLAHMGHYLPWIGGILVVAILVFVILRILRR